MPDGCCDNNIDTLLNVLCRVTRLYMAEQAVEAKVLDNLSEQTTAEKSASKTAQDIKSLRKQGMSSSATESQP